MLDGGRARCEPNRRRPAGHPAARRNRPAAQANNTFSGSSEPELAIGWRVHPASRAGTRCLSRGTALEIVSTRSRSWRTIRSLAGIVLFTAAVLKVTDWDHSPSAGLLTDPPSRLLVSAWELFLGAWLLTGRAAVAARVFAVGTFGVFAGATAWLSAQGSARCGCFGAASVPPWWMFGLDVFLVILLLVACPQNSDTPVRRTWKPVAVVGAAWAVIAAVTLSPIGAVAGAWLTGKVVTPDTMVLEIATLRPGEFATYDVGMTNRSGHRVRLVGGTWDCTCLVSGMSQFLEPGQTRPVRVNVRLPDETTTGRFVRPVEVWTDSLVQPTIRMTVVCVVRP